MLALTTYPLVVFSNRKDAIMPADVKDLVSFVLVHLIMAVLVTAFLV